MKKKEIYKIFGYHGMDGGIAAAICIRHLNDTIGMQGDKTIELQIEPVPRPVEKNQSLAGILRTHYKEFMISKKLIQNYDDFIDLAELVQKKKYLLLQEKNRMFAPAARLHALFHPTHPAIDKNAMYKSLVRHISKNSCVEDILDSEMIYFKN